MKQGQKPGWVSTDGLLLQRIYCIELTWAAKLQQADMSVIDICWFSECGNGMQLNGCVYNIISNTCFADNDGTGVVLYQGPKPLVESCTYSGNVEQLITEK